MVFGNKDQRMHEPRVLSCLTPSLIQLSLHMGRITRCVKVKLGGSEVLLWKPDEVIDDSSLMQLDVDLGFEGMKEEIGNLEKCGAGRVIGQAEVDA